MRAKDILPIGVVAGITLLTSCAKPSNEIQLATCNVRPEGSGSKRLTQQNLDSGITTILQKGSDQPGQGVGNIFTINIDFEKSPEGRYSMKIEDGDGFSARRVKIRQDQNNPNTQVYGIFDKKTGFLQAVFIFDSRTKTFTSENCRIPDLGKDSKDFSAPKGIKVTLVNASGRFVIDPITGKVSNYSGRGYYRAQRN